MDDIESLGSVGGVDAGECELLRGDFFGQRASQHLSPLTKRGSNQIHELRVIDLDDRRIDKLLVSRLF